ncbi:MAG: hypothetical protein B6I20_12595 [Bacteroidetes bacterium 4572_117]|nr:MAG: hypothetical protein B6I20_12595 [Bacteroidetes bacterium 4572_117]
MKLSEIVLKTFGWKLIGDFPNINKSVVTLAPHTSNWDFVVGKLYLNARNINNNTLMKKEMFFFPLNIILTGLGAIPVDRKNKKISMVAQTALIFKKKEEFNLFIAPEGSRYLSNQWKKGFYYIAQEANVPIVTSFIDYKKKEVGIKETINDTSDIESTMTEINNIYKDIQAKFPAKFTVDKGFS